MKKLLSYADRYCHQSSWKDLALLKFCLCAVGVVIGLLIPAHRRKAVLFAALAVFAGTYVPLMYDFLSLMLAGPEENP